MEIKCQKCGQTASDDQAFCSKCGAVLGMGDAGQAGDEPKPNLAATMVGKFPFTTPPPKPAPTPPPQQPQSQGVQAPPPQAHARPTPPPPQQPPQQQQAFPPSLTAQPSPRGGGAWLLAVVGFVAVLLVGALLIYLFFFNLRQ